MLAGLLQGLTAITTALVAVNTGAEIGGKIHRGIKQSKVKRAERRWRMSPQKAARLLRAELHRMGQPVEKVKPALDEVGVWRLLVEGTVAFPETYEGYPVIAKDTAPGSGEVPLGEGLVEVGRGGRGGGRPGFRGGGGWRGGRGWRGRGYGGGYPWWGGWGWGGPLYLRRRRSELDEVEAELDEEDQLKRIEGKYKALRGA